MNTSVIETVIWPRETALELIRACQKAAHNEACGLLFGNMEDHHIRITGCKLLRNAADHPAEHFAFDGEEWIAALYSSSPTGDNSEIAGIFHSHPSAPAVPSEEDMALEWLFPVYAIISLEHRETPSLRCYRPASARPWKELAVTFRND